MNTIIVILVILLVLFAILSMCAIIFAPKTNISEGMENKCGKPTEIDGNCKIVYKNDTDKTKIVKACRGVRSDNMMYDTDCPYSWYIDGKHNVCQKTNANLQYIEKNGFCPPENPKINKQSAHLHASSEVVDKLKNIGNSALGSFGMNLDHINACQDPHTGDYQISYGPGKQPTRLHAGSEVVDKLKNLINSILIKFGMNLDHINASQDPHTGNYRISYDPDKQHPIPRPHRKHGTGRNVPDNMDNHKYKKFIPNQRDGMAISREMYEKIGKKFIKNEAEGKGITTPSMNDSEAEVLGRMVWRTYVAEIEKKRSNSPKSVDEIIQREIQLYDKVSDIMKNDTDYQQCKKHQSIAQQASTVSSCNPLHSTHKRTTNQFGYTPKQKHDIKREEGHAFEGQPIPGSIRYFEISNAIEHCFRDRACGGVNFDPSSGEYTLMPLHARLIKKPHFLALVKNDHVRSVDPNQSNTDQVKTTDTYVQDEDAYVPITGIGYSGGGTGSNAPRDPNLLPRPWNAVYSIFN